MQKPLNGVDCCDYRLTDDTSLTNCNLSLCCHRHDDDRAPLDLPDGTALVAASQHDLGSDRCAVAVAAAAAVKAEAAEPAACASEVSVV